MGLLIPLMLFWFAGMLFMVARHLKLSIKEDEKEKRREKREARKGEKEAGKTGRPQTVQKGMDEERREIEKVNMETEGEARADKSKPWEKYKSSIWVVLDDLKRKPESAEKFLLGRTLDGTKTVKGIRQEDRNAHFYVLGGSGTGKSKFLESLIAQDIFKESGFGLIDPHGDLVREIKTAVLMGRQSIRYMENDVAVIDPTDPEYSVCLNPLEPIEGVDSAVIAAELVEAFKKIWHESWGARMQQILRNSFIALIENNLTLREVPLILKDGDVRAWLLRNVKDELCIEFFEKYERWSEREKLENSESTTNKLDDFLANPNVRDIFLSPKSTINIRNMMDNGETLLVNLDVGQLKPDASGLLGSLIMSKIQLAAMSRSDIDDDKRRPFYLYIDEFQDFASDNFVKVLSQTRKYGLFLTLANQDLAQLTSKLRASILSNCDLIACFRVSREDADIMAKNLYGGVYDEPQAWEPRIQKLQSFKDREFIFKNGKKGGVAVLQTFDVPPAWQPYHWTKEDYIENGGGFGEADIGKSYRRKRSEIRAEYKARREALGESDEPEDYRRK